LGKEFHVHSCVTFIKKRPAAFYLIMIVRNDPKFLNVFYHLISITVSSQ
jgi:hypothetical protein